MQKKFQNLNLITLYFILLDNEGTFFNSRTILHEFLHLLGIHHMQDRPDRDDYITVDYSNVKPSLKTVYWPKLQYLMNYSVPYDARSLMHYRFTSGAIDWRKPVAISKVTVNVPIRMTG